MKPVFLLLGGAAGSGKSTLARAWCEGRDRAAHIDLDLVREMIVGGFADPQLAGSEQTEQFELSARQCVSLAINYLQSGYDVVIESVVPPGEFRDTWDGLLAGLGPRIVIVAPDLDTALERSRSRDKDVMERHTRSQHAASLGWPERHRLDTSGIDIDESVRLLDGRIRELSGEMA